MPRPLIGVTLDAEKPGGYSKFPWYALRQNYLDAIDAAGGLPVALPHEPDRVADYLERIDALVVTGGAFDVDPSYYGGGAKHATVITKDRRTAFEFGVTKGALGQNKPVLGICGGQQLLHVVLGGKLIQHIPDRWPMRSPTSSPTRATSPAIRVAVAPGTQLHRIVGADELQVNSAHHQAAADAPDGVVINATAADGVIEGIEAPNYRFCIGVQWHPEFLISEGDARLFKAFLGAAAAK